MAEHFIPLADHRLVRPAIPSVLTPPAGHLADKLARPLQDLRISVTDRCNFRCVYCMPKAIFGKDYTFLPHTALLSFEEIVRLARLFIAHGVRKIRLTGGEPLLRKDIEDLIAMLAALKTADGQPLDLTLTTNGVLLARKSHLLKQAGLTRVTVSLDALDDATFRSMNDVNFPVSAVLEGLEAAHAAGLAPIKVNMVVKRGWNEDQIVPMARHFRGTPFILRFIEYMDVGSSNGWRMEEVVPSAEVVRRIAAEMPLVALDRNYGGETAERWRHEDGSGEIGIIASVTRAFCRDCTRARLSTEGKLYTCLFATRGHDLRALLREGCDDAEISAALGAIWQARGDRYSEQRSEKADLPLRKIEMSYIGG